MGKQHRHQSSHLKKHALLRDSSGRSLLNVDDPVDWAFMKSMGNGQLICPEPGCRSGFKRPYQRNKTRFLVNMPGSECGHKGKPSDGGGGKMGRLHVEIQKHLMKLAKELGLEAIREERPSYADVLFPESKYAVEVQSWNTDFEMRTRDRQRKGYQTIWLIPVGASGKEITKALFTFPAVRAGFYEFGRPKPFVDSSTWPGEKAELRLSATIATLNEARILFRTEAMDAKRFLVELFAGTRRWYPPGQLPLERGGYGVWARVQDVETLKVCRERRESTLRHEAHTFSTNTLVENEPLAGASDKRPAQKQSISGRTEEPVSSQSGTKTAPERISDTRRSARSGELAALTSAQASVGPFKGRPTSVAIKWLGRLIGLGLR